MVLKKKISTPASTSASSNPFDKGTTNYKVAAMLLKNGEHSWDDLIEAAGGSLSPRTMGIVIRDLENAGKRFTKRRDPEYGICYKLDKTGNAERLSSAEPPKRSAKKAVAPVPAAKKAAKRGRARGGATPEPAVPAKRRGRPPGSKNAPKTPVAKAPAVKKTVPKVRKRHSTRGV